MDGDVTVVLKYEMTHGGTYVENVAVYRTGDDTYPSGWKYSLHYGRIGGEVLLRYDNAHERTKGHERHTRDGVERIEFPGMNPLYDRFVREIDQLPP